MIIPYVFPYIYFKLLAMWEESANCQDDILIYPCVCVRVCACVHACVFRVSICPTRDFIFDAHFINEFVLNSIAPLYMLNA